MILEIRTYRLRPGTRDDFVRVMLTSALPLLAPFGIAVVDAGPSLVDEDGAEEAYLIRIFQDLEDRDRKETAFYGSAVWRDGPREAIVSRIENSHTIVTEISDDLAAKLPRI
jgi:NIPSNAP protein